MRGWKARASSGAGDVGGGSRGRETRGPRVEAGTAGRGAARLEPEPVGAARLGTCGDSAGGDGAAGNRGEGAQRLRERRGGLRSRGRRGREAPRARPDPRGLRPGGGRGPGFRGDPAPPPAAEAEAGGWAGSGCAQGASRPRVTQPRPPPGAAARPSPAVGS